MSKVIEKINSRINKLNEQNSNIEQTFESLAIENLKQNIILTLVEKYIKNQFPFAKVSNSN